jgi:hypothetical protein
MNSGDASLDLEGVGSDGDDGPPQALAGSVVAGVVRSGTADSAFLHNQRRHVAQVANARLRKLHKQT